MVVAALIPLVVCLLGTPFVIRWLERRAVVDVPVGRSSHVVPTPTAGGIAPATGCVIAAVLLVAAGVDERILAVAGTAAAFGLVGLVDDLRDLSAQGRLAVQVLIGLVASIVIVLTSDPSGALVAVVGIGCGVVWLAGYVNAFNFMDGINGMSSIQVTIAGLTWALVGRWEGYSSIATAGIVIAAGGAGFLPFNFSQARVFLGDVGSYFMGSWLASTTLLGVALGIPPVVMAAPLVLYLADTGITLARRALRHAPLTEPHRDHAYQQLVVSGRSHAQVTLTAAAVTAAGSAVGLAAHDAGVLGQAIAGVVLVVMAVTFVFLPDQNRHSRVAATPPPEAAPEGRASCES